jgi:chemotaxis protein methyltransferase CheR
MLDGRGADGLTASVAPGAVPALSDHEFLLLRDWIHAQAGIHLAPAKKSLLVARLGRRLRALGLPSFDAYYRLVTSRAGSSERVNLLDCITTNETHFFRGPRQFEYLDRTLFPAWRADARARRASASVRVWSAGCSTGEEPFSLAMLLLDHFPPASGFALSILATDLSTRVLAQAGRATWPLDRSEEISLPHRKAYMLRGTGSQQGLMRAGPEIRSLVRFERLNLNDPRYAVDGVFDLILCRNVLIYFDAASRAAVIDRLIDRLAPRGVLLLGHTEGLRDLTGRVRSLVPTIYAHVRGIERAA